MHVGFLCQPFDTARPPTPNSIGLWVYEVATRLPADWRVTVYVRGGGRRPRTEQHGSIRYCLLPVSYDAAISQCRPINRRLPEFARGSTHLVYATMAAVDMRMTGVDVVHTVNFSQFAPVIRRIAPRARVVLNMVCEWLSQVDRDVVGARLASAHVVMGCSDHITNLVRERFPTASLSCVTVGNGIDPVAMRPATERRRASNRLLFVGRMSPEKGIHTLIEAMKEIVRRVPDVQLDVLGGRSQLPREYLVDLSDDPKVRALERFYAGDDREVYSRTLEAAVRDSGLDKHVCFHAAVPHADLDAFYSNADVVVNPSLSESFGRSLIEGMAFGVPVVAARTGGMPEIVSDGCEGYIVPADDPPALADAIVRLLADRELAHRMGVAGREAVTRRFDWNEIAARATNVYAEASGND